jgi:type IV pilus assembly protein PilM
MMLVNLGALHTAVVIARGADAMFVKYVDVGGQQLDQVVARSLKMSPADAAALRRHNGDRRADQRDPEVTRSIAEAVRPELERLTNEISMCLRYYSVTFRGQPLARIIAGGGEATEGLVEWLGGHLDIPCELGDPLRTYDKPASTGRSTQWDVAAGLALREFK